MLIKLIKLKLTEKTIQCKYELLFIFNNQKLLIKNIQQK